MMSRLIEVDESYLQRPQVHQLITEWLKDDMRSVRSEAVSLIGNHLVQSPESLDLYYDAIVERLQVISLPMLFPSLRRMR